MAEAIVAAAKALLKKLVVDTALDKEKRNKFLLIIGSIAVGLLFLLFALIAVLSSMGEIESPDISVNFDESEFFENLDCQQQEKISLIESDGQAIADSMSAIRLREQTIKAQLIYFSYFESGKIVDFSSYAEMFRNEDDEILISDINSFYGLEISYEDFMRSYVMVMNATINEYMFTDSGTKNCADLAAWARNAYVSGWGFQENCFGEMDENLRYRCVDNVADSAYAKLKIDEAEKDNIIKQLEDEKILPSFNGRSDDYCLIQNLYKIDLTAKQLIAEHKKSLQVNVPN